MFSGSKCEISIFLNLHYILCCFLVRMIIWMLWQCISYIHQYRNQSRLMTGLWHDPHHLFISVERCVRWIWRADCSLGKKLVGKSQPKDCYQMAFTKWLSGRWAPPGGGRSQVVSPGVSLGTRALQRLSVAWMMRYSTPSARLLVSPGCVVQLARQNEGVPSRRTWTGLESRPKETPWDSIKSSAVFCTYVGTIPGMSTGCENSYLWAALQGRT